MAAAAVKPMGCCVRTGAPSDAVDNAFLSASALLLRCPRSLRPCISPLHSSLSTATNRKKRDRVRPRPLLWDIILVCFWDIRSPSSDPAETRRCDATQVQQKKEPQKKKRRSGTMEPESWGGRRNAGMMDRTRGELT